MELSEIAINGIGLNCNYGFDNGVRIGVELPLSELELNRIRDLIRGSELEWNCRYRNWI